MEREIKFRVWSELTKSMSPNPQTLKWWVYFLGKNCDQVLMERSIETMTFLQWTGLLDKNGKEIYEGDIVDVTSNFDDYVNYIQVYWCDEDLWWGYIKKDGDDTELGQLVYMLDKNSEIIGNIYENPELL